MASTAAVREVRRTAPMPVVPLARLVAYGSAVPRGVRWTAVEDDCSVVLTTSQGPGFTGAWPASVITNLGGGGST